MPSKDKMKARNSKFSSDTRAKGLDQGGIASKEFFQAHNTEASDTAPERASNEQREDKGE